MTSLACILALTASSGGPLVTMETAEISTPSIAYASQENTRRGFSYTFVEVGASTSNLDGISDNSDSLGLQGSYGFADRFFAFASYSRSSVHVSVGELGATSSGDLDTDAYQLGLGAHFPIADPLDLVLDLSWIHSEASFGSLSSNDDGYAAEAGVRWWLADPLEVGAAIQHVDFNSAETGFAASARYYFNENFSLGVGYSHFDESDTVGGTLRWSW